MKYKIWIVWGGEDTIEENRDACISMYAFRTREERAAFLHGVSEAIEFDECQIAYSREEAEAIVGRPIDHFDDAVEGLVEYYPALRSSKLVETLRKKVNIPDTGNEQKDYENVRDQIERLLGTE